MADEEKQSHWNDLADQLGAEPSEEGDDTTSDEEAAPQTPPAFDAVEASQEMPSHQTGDWRSLADSLGIEVDFPIAPEPEETESKPEEAVRAEEPSIDDIFAPPKESSHTESIDVLEVEDEFTTESTEVAAVTPELDEVPESFEPDFEGESTGIKHALDFESPGGIDFEQTAEASTEAEEVDEEEDSQSVTPDAEAEAEPAEATEEEEERPRRRRRRRGRRGGRRTSTEETEQPDAAEPSATAPPSDDFDEDDSDEEHDRSKRRRPTHRNIPTWDDAIGVIVTANMDARSKAGKSGSSGGGSGGRRSRGGRGRGRGGGGGKKSSPR